MPDYRKLAIRITKIGSSPRGLLLFIKMTNKEINRY